MQMGKHDDVFQLVYSSIAPQQHVVLHCPRRSDVTLLFSSLLNGETVSPSAIHCISDTRTETQLHPILRVRINALALRNQLRRNAAVVNFRPRALARMCVSKHKIEKLPS